MFHRIATIALHTFKQSVRDKVLYNLVVFAVLMAAASLVIGGISIGIEQIILVNLGLSAIAVFGLLIAIFIGISLISREIERKTLYNVLSKPVARWEFILGKYLGLLLTLAVNAGVMTAGFYVALFYQTPHLERVDLGSLEAVYFILLELALVVGVALLFSCISSPVLAALFTFCVFIIGNFLNDLRWYGHQAGSAAMKHITAALYYLFPNFRDFNVISSVAHGTLVPARLLISNSLYALLYAVVLISAAIMIFEEREFQ
jgi:ABC-type transport system involved in multi-copper enzyme maturation permease subunit